MEDPIWPPQSSQQVFQSSPNGRKRPRESAQASNANRRSPRKVARQEPPPPDDLDDEDEETLRLQLQAIEARLKLKRLQNKKIKTASPNSRSEELLGDPALASARTNATLSPKSCDGHSVHVPLSPVRRPDSNRQDARSPGRVLLGIDKGKGGKDISLSRPLPVDSLRRTTKSVDLAARNAPSDGILKERTEPAGKSFNARLAERRECEQQSLHRRARTRQLQQQKSRGFDIQESEVDAYRKASAAEPRHHLIPHQSDVLFSRDQVMAAVADPRKAANSKLGNSQLQRPAGSGGYKVNRARNEADIVCSNPRNTTRGAVGEVKPSTTASYLEPLSATPLSNRIIPHDVLVKELKGKKVVDITSLLRDVKNPDWEIPASVVAEDEDFVVFGIIGRKSSPLDHKDTHKDERSEKSANKTSAEQASESWENDQRKYMIITLVASDLRWSVDTYLFATAYSRWRNLPQGSLVAMLNPIIMPPPPDRLNTNRWSFKLTTSEDTILEIGTSLNISWCSSIKKNGDACNQWIDGRRFKHCEFHMSQGIQKAKGNRMEAQGSGFGRGWNVMQGKDFQSNGWKRGGARKTGDKGMQYDHFAQSNYYVSPAGFKRKDAADLFDNEDMVRDRGMSREERTRKLLADREREMQMACQLGKTGRGAGAEYMKRQYSTLGHSENLENSKEDRTELRSAVDAQQLGLTKGKDIDVQLSPIARRYKMAEHSTKSRNLSSNHGRTRKVGGKGAAEERTMDDGNDSDDLEIV